LKKQYQIVREKAVRAFREQAQQTEQNIQTILPLSEVVWLLEQGLGQLIRAVGQELMQSVMEAEVRQRVGDPHQPNRQREYYRWGQEQGYCVVDDRKFRCLARAFGAGAGPKRRWAATNCSNGALMKEAVWTKVMHGLSIAATEKSSNSLSRRTGWRSPPLASTSFAPAVSGCNGFVACALRRRRAATVTRHCTHGPIVVRRSSNGACRWQLHSLLARLSRIDVLVIDDWAMASLGESERRDFWEICEDRYQVRSTILASRNCQSPAGTSRLAIRRWPTASSTGLSTTAIASRCLATRCARTAGSLTHSCSAK
jgi:hypothetical protein